MSKSSNAPDPTNLEAIRQMKLLPRYVQYTKMSGPGWLQGAITLGGGSLASALYLGVVTGYEMLWLQPFAMILGVIMLAAISYVSLSIPEKPFRTMRENLSPALAWGWLIAAMIANIVWALPQFALGTAALQKNLFPELLGGSAGKVIAALALLAIGIFVVWFYNSGSKGIRIFELILKLLVGLVVVSFFGVVFVMTLKGALDWGAILKGFIPHPSRLAEPTPALREAIQTTSQPAFWSDTIFSIQREKVIAAFATAVGINMTFLLPYSMLRKKWGKAHREMAIFDLSIGLVIPFFLATACVVIAAGSQFHAKSQDVFAEIAAGGGKSTDDYHKLVDRRIAFDPASAERHRSLSTQIKDKNTSPSDLAAAKEQLAQLRASVPEGDRRLAAMVATRDNFRLAETLTPLTGPVWAQKVFGIGVLGMAVSTIIILMLINGFCVCELFGREPEGQLHRIGSLIPGVIGVLGPFVWAGAAPALAIPTSVLGGAMLPIAYFAFLLMMNSKAVLGDNLPTGKSRIGWNTLMIIATLVATTCSIWGLYTVQFKGLPLGKIGIAILATLLVLGAMGYIKSERRARGS